MNQLEPPSEKEIVEAESEFVDWITRKTIYFLFRPEIKIQDVCYNANTSLCKKCEMPECDLAGGYK